MPAIFLDPAYTLSCHWTISSSQIPSDYFTGYGWGEVVPDGFGIAYMVKDESLHFNVAGLIGGDVPLPDDTCINQAYWQQWRLNRVKWMKQALESALDLMHDILRAAPVPQPKLTSSSISRLSASVTSSKALLKEDSSSKKKPVDVTSHSTQTSPIASSLLRQHANTSTSALSDTKSMQSVEASNTSLGFSLAYPERTRKEELAGVIGEDVGFLEFDWGRSESTGSRVSDKPRQPKRLLKMLKEWAVWQEATGQASQTEEVPSDNTS